MPTVKRLFLAALSLLVAACHDQRTEMFVRVRASSVALVHAQGIDGTGAPGVIASRQAIVSNHVRKLLSPRNRAR
jgi:hypothetical protein